VLSSHSRWYCFALGGFIGFTLIELILLFFCSDGQMAMLPCTAAFPLVRRARRFGPRARALTRTFKIQLFSGHLSVSCPTGFAAERLKC
jgi:hypothetical protein